MTAGEDLVLVTGASGFVGSAVARALRRRGLRLRALARPGRPVGNLRGFDGEIVEGDARDAASMAAALKGVRWLFHVAADYRLWARDPEEIVRNNLQNARVVMQAALDAGVERIVYTSSVATLSLDRLPADEDAQLEEAAAVGAYKRSKLLAERLVQRMVAEQALPAVIVNPSTPIGPRDVRPTPTGRVIVEAAAGRVPAFVDTGLNLVHVDDVAEGHWLAFERGKVGERYVLGGQDATLQQMLSAIAQLTGRRPPRVRLPRGPLYPLALAAEAVAQLTGREPFLTVDALKMSRKQMFFSSAKAERELGYVARPYAEGLKDALNWFRQEGYV